MQKVLCVNVSSNPVEATLLGVGDKSFEVLEQHSADLGRLFLTADVQVATDETSVLEEDTDNNAKLLEHAAFRELLNRFSDTWTSSLLIITGADYISIDVKLPFSSSKEIGKIVELEVQDQVPFEVDEFLIDHCLIEQGIGGALNEIHVGMCPRKFLSRIMAICKACEFDPVVVTTPASALAALYHIAPDYFSTDCALLYMADEACYSCVIFGGKVRSDRVFLNTWLQSADDQQRYQELLKEFKIYLAALEQRYAKNAEKVYIIQTNLPRSTIQGTLGRDVTILDTSDIIKGAEKPFTVLAAAASVFVRDYQPLRPLSNFRTKEFAFRPQLKNIYGGLKALSSYILLTVLLLIGLLGVKIATDLYQINSVQSAIAEEISKLAPELDAEKYQTISSINEITSTLEAELVSLGSPSRFTAIDVLSQLTRDLRKFSALDINQLRIAGNRVILAGNAESYAQSDELRAVFRRRHEMFCTVTRDTSAGTGGTRGFQYTLELCS